MRDAFSREIGYLAGKSVLDSITEAGFLSTSRVYGHAMRNLGMTPSSYRAGGEGETIAYAHRNTALGPLLMAATGRGVCFAQFGPSEAALTEQLRKEFPKAELTVSSMTHSTGLLCLCLVIGCCEATVVWVAIGGVSIESGP